MERPPADQLGTQSSESSVVIRLVTWLSRSTTYTSARPAGPESKDMLRPSGEKRGLPLGSAPRVSCVHAVPSASQTQICGRSSSLDRVEAKATRPPSGEYAGPDSIRVDEKTICGAGRVPE